MSTDARLRQLMRRLATSRRHPPDPGRRDELRTRLEARVVSMGEESRESGWSGWTGLTLAARLAVATAGVVALGVGACALPTEVDMDLGMRVELAFDDPEAGAAALEDVARALERMTEGRGATAAAPVRVEIQASMTELRDGEGGVERRLTATVDLWAPALDEAAVIEVIERAGDGVWVEGVQRVEGPVETTMGARLGHEVFDLDLDDASVEEARRRILEDLEARGLAEHAEVHVSDENGHRRVEVRVSDVKKEVAPGHTEDVEP